ncbi:4758_t:CDS:1, partial [Cetraspora pellucida]
QPNNDHLPESENAFLMPEYNLKGLRKAQELDLNKSRVEMLSELGELDGLKNRYLEDLNDTYEFREALALYVEPRGKWKVPIIKSSA